MARNHRAGRGNNGGLEHHRREDHRGRAPPRSGRRRLRTRRHHLLLSADDERAPRHQVQDRHRLHGRQSDQPRDGARRSRSPEQHLVELEGDQGGLAQGEENHRDCASRPARARPRCSLGRGCGSHARGAPAHRATGVRHPARPAVRHQRSAGRPRRRAPLSLRQHDERPGVPVGSAGARLRRRAGAGREDAADRGKGAFDAQRRGGESQGTAGVILPILALILAAAQQRCYLAAMTASAISNIRNFSIVAHIDHGKSTLADRLIQLTGALEEREMVEQVLDSMDIERERGITIKAQTVRLNYRARDGKTYVLNLIDTPGHVDFAYEVNRSLAACEGSLLVVDSWYASYLGVVVLVRIVDGELRKGHRIRMMGTGAAYDIDRVGVFTPKMAEADKLGPGEIGFLTASIKEVADTRVGDTITDDRKPTASPLPGFRPAIPVVFCGLFPVDAANFEDLRAAMGRLRLNDASFSFEMETSAALGFGFRCGFLGLLHLEIIQERLEREFNLNLIATAPSVIYKLKLRTGQE